MLENLSMEESSCHSKNRMSGNSFVFKGEILQGCQPKSTSSFVDKVYLTFLHCQIYGNSHATEVDKFENEYYQVVFVDFIDQLHVDMMKLIHIHPEDKYLHQKPLHYFIRN